MMTTIIVGAICAFTSSILTTLIVRSLNNREKKITKEKEFYELVRKIETRMEGIDSFGKKLPTIEGRITAREEFCKSMHSSWDGKTERRKRDGI